MFKLIISSIVVFVLALSAQGEVEPVPESIFDLGGLLNDLLKKAQQVNEVKGKELEVQILIKSSGQIIKGLETLIGQIPANSTLSEGAKGNLATSSH